VAYLSEDQEGGPDFAELSQLPRIYGEPILFAIPRDPRTLFTYWNVDWASEFAKSEPFDRQVYLRVKKTDGAEESESVIEPMLGSYYARVMQSRGTYRVEIGYYQPANEWRSIATSDEVVMPPETLSEKVDVDVVTVPFHLSFQRIVNLFQTSNDGSLVDSISELQGRASEEEESLTAEEREILRAMNLSLSDVAAARSAYLDSNNREALRKRMEAILGFGSSSPAGGFGGRSRA
jgi:plasmid stability protein